LISDVVHRVSRGVRKRVERLRRSASNFGYAIVRPIERTFEATFGRMQHWIDRVERVDEWLLALVKLLVWPFQALWRLVVAVFHALVPAAVRASTAKRFTKAKAKAGATLWIVIEKLNLDKAVLWLVWLLQPIWKPIGSLLGAVNAWLLTRPYKEMLWAIPVLALLSPIVGAAVWGATIGKGSIAGQYRAGIEEAKEADDYATIALYERKLAQLGVDTTTRDYQTALELAKNGEIEQAYERMRKLASENQPGHLPAHYWIFMQLVSSSLNVPDDERLELAAAHLDHIKTLGMRREALDALRAILMVQRGELEEAADILAPLVQSNSWAAQQRFQLNLQLEREDEAREDAKMVRIHYSEQQRRGHEPLTSQEYQAWAQAERLLGNTAAWARVVRDWLEEAPENAYARQSVAMLNHREFNDLLRSNYADPGALAQRLVTMVQLVEDPLVLEPQIAALYGVRGQSAPIRAMIDDLITSPDTPPALKATLGALAAQEGNMELARTLLGQVVQADPINAVAWNNYAWALSQPPEPRYEEALEAVNRALKIQPNEARFRETRGQVMVALGRWEQAVLDLEYALNGITDAGPLHIALATAYENLGLAELAAVHRRAGE
jgi:tetratricopeptide (TPR) repeat protein